MFFIFSKTFGSAKVVFFSLIANYFYENDKFSFEIRVFIPDAVKNIFIVVFITIVKQRILYTV